MTNPLKLKKDRKFSHEKVLTLELLDSIFGSKKDSIVRFQLWDGTLWPSERESDVTVILKNPSSLRSLLSPGDEVGMGEAYLYDDIDIVGNIESVFELAFELAHSSMTLLQKAAIAKKILQLPRPLGHPTDRRAHLKGSRHSIRRDRQAISYHYDVSNEFYSLWLDRRMVYSCAYFRSPGDSIDDAQLQKLDLICRKLRLKEGDNLLDIGCGWGSLVLYAAERYGVNATGITLSQSQVEYANNQIEKYGLASRCNVILKDYRELEQTEQFDAVASIGMFEHVGESKLLEYFNSVFKVLKKGGVFLNHAIARRLNEAPKKGRGFSDFYVFPDGELLPISTSLKAAEEANFEVRDVESLREHYAMTLRHWVKRLEAQHEEALKHVDEVTWKIWRLFMSGSAFGFSNGRLDVYQSLLLKPLQNGTSGLPLTREEWYIS